MEYAGKDGAVALALATDRAKASGEVRYLCLDNETYWTYREEPVNAGSYVALYPDGTMKAFKG